MNLGLSLLRHSKLDQDGNVRVPVRGFKPTRITRENSSPLLLCRVSTTTSSPCGL